MVCSTRSAQPNWHCWIEIGAYACLLGHHPSIRADCSWTNPNAVELLGQEHPPPNQAPQCQQYFSLATPKILTHVCYSLLNSLCSTQLPLLVRDSSLCLLVMPPPQHLSVARLPFWRLYARQAVSKLIVTWYK